MIDNYETFFEEVWDYVSHHIVSDDLWEKHTEKFQELTYDLYKFYENEVLSCPNSSVNSPKIYARLIEAFVRNFNEVMK